MAARTNSLFECELAESANPALPEDPDPNQTGVEWLPVDTIDEQPLLPELGERWSELIDSESTTRFHDSS
jgi:hypothetical protein